MQLKILKIKNQKTDVWGNENKTKWCFLVDAEMNGKQGEQVIEALSEISKAQVQEGATIEVNDKPFPNRVTGYNQWTVAKSNGGGFKGGFKKATDSVGQTVGNAISNASNIIAAQIAAGADIGDNDALANDIGDLARKICIQANTLHKWGNDGWVVKGSEIGMPTNVTEEDNMPF